MLYIIPLHAYLFLRQYNGKMNTPLLYNTSNSLEVVAHVEAAAQTNKKSPNPHICTSATLFQNLRTKYIL